MSISQTMKEQHRLKLNGAGSDDSVREGNVEPPSSPGATHVVRQNNRPSPSIHEDVISRHHSRNEETGETVYDPVVSRLSNAVGAARLAAERVGRVATAIFANELQTVPARHREVKQ